MLYTPDPKQFTVKWMAILLKIYYYPVGSYSTFYNDNLPSVIFTVRILKAKKDHITQSLLDPCANKDTLSGEIDN